MTADLTPLLEKQKALRRQVFWTTMGSVVGATGWVAMDGFTWWTVLFVLAMGAVGFAAAQNGRNRLARLELEQTTASLATQRALLRRSSDRRDAAEGLSLSSDATGGDLTVGQDGKLSEDP